MRGEMTAARRILCAYARVLRNLLAATYSVMRAMTADEYVSVLPFGQFGPRSHYLFPARALLNEFQAFLRLPNSRLGHLVLHQRPVKVSRSD